MVISEKTKDEGKMEVGIMGAHKSRFNNRGKFLAIRQATAAPNSQAIQCYCHALKSMRSFGVCEELIDACSTKLPSL
ncbi:hypothetical protein SETIT_4G237400v2 [Setaria italica]|uniref:Uncharacterized protein n=1 Tax=Setaria italica TaxID=4555 RepID=A0A368QXH4_SETIT|nr:hypothetical protein SETIT_4G237400v2 [Setaria italica]